MSGVYNIMYHAPKTEADGTKKFIIRWIIPEYSDFVKEVEAKHIRDLSTNRADWADDADEDTKFLFKMEFLGRKKSSVDIYYLPPVSMSLKYTLKMDGPNNSTKAMQDFSIVQPNIWQFVLEINNVKSSGYLYNDREFDFIFEFTVNKEIKLDPSPFCEPEAELNRDLGNILNNSIYSDVTIKSVEGVEFQTHKLVLAARSVVLKANFEHNTVESVTNIIETPFETEVLQEVLGYIYTDNTPKLNEIPEKLLAAADYYQLNRLKHLCEKSLFQKLNVDNAIATLEIADLHSATILKTKTLDFICDGRAGLITKTQGWIDHKPGALTKTILESISAIFDK